MITRNRLIVSSSCRCASTSTSSPCAHVPTPRSTTSIFIVKRKINNSSIQFDKSLPEVTTATTDRSEDSKAFNYTAPLWNQKKWFIPMNNDWRWWMKKSQTDLPTISTSTTKSTSNSNSLLLSPPPSPPPRSSNFPNDALLWLEVDTQIKNYLALREPTHRYLLSLSKTNRLGKIAKALRMRELPLIQNYLIADLTDMNLKGLNVPMNVETKEEGVEKLPELLQLVDSREEILNLIKIGYRGSPLAPELHAERPHLDDIQLHGELWATFINTHDLSNSPQDLHLALSFLHYLVSPIRDTAPAEDAQLPAKYLPLALVIFKNLVDNHISEFSVANPEPDTSGGITLQKVFLRTIIAASLDEGFCHLAYSALDSLALLRELHPSTTPVDQIDPDLILVKDTVSALISVLSEERLDNYRPRVAFDTPYFKAPLTQAYTLVISLLARYTYTPLQLLPNSKDRSPISTSTDKILTTFIDEAAERNRWDLVAKVWEFWGDGETGKGYIMPRRRRKLLRWYGGVAPFATYPLRESEKARSTRRIESGEFADLAAATFRIMIKGQDRGQIDRWSLREKSDWIELLCDSRAAEGRSRDLARRFCTAFMGMYPRGSTYPFTLTGSALLSLVRCSTPPVDKDNRLAFNTSIVNNYISTITSPSSPYSSSSGSSKNFINHYDLTTLAACYSLMNDYSSVTQVYSKLLQQKILPDLKDVELILKSLATQDPIFARNFLLLALDLGAKIPVELYQQVMLATVIYHRLKQTNYETSLQQIYSIARGAGGMSLNDSKALTAYGYELRVTGTMRYLKYPSVGEAAGDIFKAIGLDRDSDRKEIIPGALRAVLNKIERERHWRLAMMVYDRINSIYGTLNEEAYRVTVEVLINALEFRSELIPELQDRIRDRLIKYRDDLFDKSKDRPRIKELKTYEVAIRSAFFLKDLESVIILIQAAERDNFYITLTKKQAFRRRFLGLGKYLGHPRKELVDVLKESKVIDV